MKCSSLQVLIQCGLRDIPSFRRILKIRYALGCDTVTPFATFAISSLWHGQFLKGTSVLVGTERSFWLSNENLGEGKLRWQPIFHTSSDRQTTSPTSLRKELQLKRPKNVDVQRYMCCNYWWIDTSLLWVHSRARCSKILAREKTQSCPILFYPILLKRKRNIVCSSDTNLHVIDVFGHVLRPATTNAC